MRTNKPVDISVAEWREIMAVPTVKDGWGLDVANETPEEFASMVYAVRFAFVSGGPGYVGDLYILHGDALGEPPIILLRGEGGALQVVD